MQAPNWSEIALAAELLLELKTLRVICTRTTTFTKHKDRTPAKSTMLRLIHKQCVNSSHVEPYFATRIPFPSKNAHRRRQLRIHLSWLRKWTGAAYPSQTEWLVVSNGSHDEPELSLCITQSSNIDVRMFLQNATIKLNQCLARSAKTKPQQKRNKCSKHKTKELPCSPHNRRQNCYPLQY
jgi:hypothetical protein